MTHETLGARLQREWTELWANQRKRLGWFFFFGWLAACYVGGVLFEADHLEAVTLLAVVLPLVFAWWKGWVKPKPGAWSYFFVGPLLMLAALGILVPFSLPAARWFVILSAIVLLGGFGLALDRMWATARRMALGMVFLAVALGTGAFVGISSLGLELWGYIDKSGRFIIPPQFLFAYPFHEGLAPVMPTTRWGYSDKTGMLVIPERFGSADSFHHDLAVVSDGWWEPRWLINKSGHALVWPGEYEDIIVRSGDEEPILVRSGGKYGFVDKTGKLIIPAQFDDAHEFFDGLAVVKSGASGRRLFGAIDRTGAWVLPPQYTTAGYRFSSGLLAVHKGEKAGFVDRTGRAVIPFRYKHVFSFQEELARVEEGSMYGYVNRHGKEILPPQFERAGSFSDGLAAVKKHDKWGFIDTTGKLVIPHQFDGPQTHGYGPMFVNGLAIVAQGGQYGVINRTAAVVARPEYDEAEHAGEGMIRIKRDGRYGYLDATGKEVIPRQFSRALDFSEGLAPAAVPAGIWETLARIVVVGGDETRENLKKSLP